MHTIRLGQPWQCDDFMGVARYRRTFHKPTGLESGERVWLVVEPPRNRAIVRLNGQALGEVQQDSLAGRFDVTELLGASNALEIDVEHSASEETDRLTGGVRLEIS